MLGLPLNVATITHGCIFPMLFSDFRACGPISIPTYPIEALTVFPCRRRNKRPSIARIVVFNIFAMKVSVFLHAYHVYVMIYRRSCLLR